jgi:hypothetical protein
MDDKNTIACSLGAGELEERMAEIAAVGAGALIAHVVDDRRHVLRFRSGGDTRERLERIVAAEAECCAFLDLSLREERDEIVLSISAAGDGFVMATDLANAFAGDAGMTGEQVGRRGGAWLGAAGFLMALCCLAGPAVLGAVAGATVGGALGIAAAAAVAVAVAIAVVVLRRRGGSESRC